MPNQYIIDYIRRNKDRFPFEVLREKLLKAGYPAYQIVEAEELVYKPKKISETPFWDFWHKKFYTSGSQKILDLMIGFIFTIVLKYIMEFGLRGFTRYGDYGLSFLIFLTIIIYLFIKRKYIAWGIICGIIFSFTFPFQYMFY